MISFRQLPQELSAISGKKWIWIGLGFAAGLATHIYYVQEMLAALIIFFALFAGVSIVALAIFLLVRACKPVVAWATPKVLRVNEKYKMACSRFPGLKPSRLYRVGLRAGGTALTVSWSAQKKMANRLGNWLTQKVS